MNNHKLEISDIPSLSKDVLVTKEEQSKPEREKRATDFIDEIASLSERYGLSLSHEDTHGAFVVEKYNQENIEWLKAKKGTDETVNRFIDEIASLSERYGLSLSHEDTHGAFVVEKYNQENIEWLRDYLE